MYGSLPSTWPNPDVTFKRNGMNLRVQKTAAGISTLYRYDTNNHLIGEYTGSGSAIQETIYLGDQPIGIMQGTQRYYIYADHLNTPRLISNTANQVRWKWESDPFGTDVPNENPAGLGIFNYNLRFPGQYFDKETGLSNNYYRDYDPSTGRYLQSDPIGLQGGINTYAYVDGNPISKVDPRGLYGYPWEISPNFDPVIPYDQTIPPQSREQCIAICAFDFANPFPDFATEKGAEAAGEKAGGKVAGQIAGQIMKKVNRVKGVYDAAVCIKECKDKQPKSCTPDWVRTQFQKP